MWLAAATSGYEEDTDNACTLGIVTVVFAVMGCALLAAWWRRPGAYRDYPSLGTRNAEEARRERAGRARRGW
jgi:hypothetical protein